MQLKMSQEIERWIDDCHKLSASSVFQTSSEAVTEKVETYFLRISPDPTDAEKDYAGHLCAGMIYLARNQRLLLDLGILEREPTWRRLTADDYVFAILYWVFRNRPIDEKLYEVDPKEFANRVETLRAKKNARSLEE